MSADCLFCRIVAGEIPSTVVLETDDLLAFHDVNPQAPTHVLVIPKEHYPTAGTLAAADTDLAGRLLATAAEVAKSEGIDADGYRMVLNTGENGQQTVFHVHCHVIGGRAMTWPPG